MKNFFFIFSVFLIFFVPFSPQFKFKGMWITFSDIGCVIFFLAYTLFIIFNKKEKINIKNLPLFHFVLAFLFFLFISILFSPDKLISLKEFIKIFFIFVLFYLFYLNLNKEHIQLLSYAIFVSSLIISVVYIHDFFLTKQVLVFERIWKTGLTPYTQLNSLGMFFVITIPFNFYFVLIEKKVFKKLLFLICLIPQIMGLFLTYSRAAWFSFIIAIFIFTFYKVDLKKIILFIFIFFSLFLSIRISSKDIFSERLIPVFKYQDGSLIERTKYIKIAFKFLKEKPLFGVGLGRFGKEARIRFQVETYDIVHNVFLQYGVEAGIFSMLCLIFILFKYFKEAVEIYRFLSNNHAKIFLLCVLISFLSFTISAQAGDFFIKSIKEYFSLLLALPYVIKRYEL
jgi:O-antigen ligase